MKKKIFILLVVIALALSSILFLKIYNYKNNKNFLKNSYILDYEKSITNIPKKYFLTEEEKNYIEKEANNMKVLESLEMVDLVLLKDVEVVIDDENIISIQKNEKEYCYYFDKETKAKKLAKMPESLYAYIMQLIEK